MKGQIKIDEIDKFKEKNTKRVIKELIEKIQNKDKNKENEENLKKFKKEQHQKQNIIKQTLSKENEKNKTQRIINSLLEEREKLNGIKLPSQNEAINILEKEKENEKDKNTRETIEIIIQIIKDFFAKCDEEQKKQIESMQEKIIDTIEKNKTLTKNTLEILERNKELELLAKEKLGKNIVDYAKKYAISINKTSNDIART